jgi:hypothetical protein
MIRHSYYVCTLVFNLEFAIYRGIWVSKNTSCLNTFQAMFNGLLFFARYIPRLYFDNTHIGGKTCGLVGKVDQRSTNSETGKI